ncbi:MAG TPA: extracellular solute-binding protein [Thiotrichaceae bacterium]|nr:extracellular solute-binding protein [Thiotrichaceae bacterium]
MTFKIAPINFLSKLKTFGLGTLLIGLSLLFVNSSSLLAADQVSPSKRLFVNSSSLPSAEEVSQTSKTPVEISIIYAPEEAAYLVDAIKEFNESYRNGKDPKTGKTLAKDESPILVKGEAGSSGVIAKAIINAIINPDNEHGKKPTIFSPSVSHWLSLVNYKTRYKTRQSVFDLKNKDEIRDTARAPVVIAIWESRLKAIQAKHGEKPVGWEELLAVLNSPKGWADYGIKTTHNDVYYGHTDPFVSSTALSTLISEFYASARYHAKNPNLSHLKLAQVKDKKVQQGVRNIEHLIRHYSSRTTEFKEYIAQGPDYLDFVALEENDLIYINQQREKASDQEDKLVALYPKEGTFIHGHPFAILNAAWVNKEQRKAAKTFTDFILSKDIQEKVLAHGFRPVNSDVTLAYPITQKYGVDPKQPFKILPTPTGKVVAAIQKNWKLVKKQTDVLLLIDTSDSMNSEDKLGQAKEAALVFLDKMSQKNRVGLISFNNKVKLRVPLNYYEANKANLRQEVKQLSSSGLTSLYDAILRAFEILKKVGSQDKQRRINAVVVLSDGHDTSSNATLESVELAIEAHRQVRNPIIVLPVAYGSRYDHDTLFAIAEKSATKVKYGNPNTIQEIFENIGSFF